MHQCPESVQTWAEQRRRHRGRSSVARGAAPDDDENDTTPLFGLKGVQAAKTANLTAAAFKAKAGADKKEATDIKKTLNKRKREAKHAEKVAKDEQKFCVWHS